jgi:hypothetical protein
MDHYSQSTERLDFLVRSKTALGHDRFQPSVSNACERGRDEHRTDLHSLGYGGVAWPSLLRPQQTTVPSVSRPQVCPKPPVTEAKVPAGAAVCP